MHDHQRSSRRVAVTGLLLAGLPACDLDKVDHEGSCPTRELPSDFEGEDLELLHGYTHVGGDLVVPSDTTDLSALGCLEVVDGNLVISGADGLETLAGLEGLRSVGGLDLSHLPALESTAGLAGLREIHGAVEITELTALRTMDAPAGLERFDGSLRVYELPALEHWDAPLGVTQLTEWIELVHIAPAASVGAFAEIESATEIYVGGDASAEGVRFDALQSADRITLESAGGTIDSLVSLAEVGTLRVRGSLGEDLSGLSSLTSAHALSITESPNLGSLTGLEALHTLTQLEILAAPVLTDLDGLSGWREMPALQETEPYGPAYPAIHLSGCPELTDISALAGIESDGLDGLVLENVPKLVELTMWPALRRLGRLYLSRTGVQTLDGLAGVTTLEQIVFAEDGTLELHWPFWLELTDNPALVDVSGLSASLALAAEWCDVVVQDNPGLPTCAVEELVDAFAAAGRMDGTYDVAGNDDEAMCAGG